MKMLVFIGIILAVSLNLVMPGVSFGQSSNCVVLSTNDNTALVRCDGGSTQRVDMGNKAELYEVGKRVDMSGSSGSSASTTGISGSRKSRSFSAPATRKR